MHLLPQIMVTFIFLKCELFCSLCLIILRHAIWCCVQAKLYLCLCVTYCEMTHSLLTDEQKL